MVLLPNIVRVLKGEESLLLILPKKVNLELKIDHRDLLEYRIYNDKIIIQKINPGQEFLEKDNIGEIFHDIS